MVKVIIKPGSYASPEDIEAALGLESYINQELDIPQYQAELEAAWIDCMVYGVAKMRSGL